MAAVITERQLYTVHYNTLRASTRRDCGAKRVFFFFRAFQQFRDCRAKRTSSTLVLKLW